MGAKGIFELKNLIALLLISITFFSGITSVNSAHENDPISLETIFQNVDKSFNDTTFGGYFSIINKNGVVNYDKYLSDYSFGIEAYTRLIQSTGNNSYLSQIKYFLNSIQNLQSSKFGYKLIANRNWTNISTTININAMAFLLSAYIHLYNLTLNPVYLNTSLNIYDFIQTYFHDSINGGYYYDLNPADLSIVSSQRKTNTYGNLASAFLELYSNTNNKSILLNGFNLLNNTISIAFSYNYNYFIPTLNGTNNPSSANGLFITTDQINLALALLQYSNCAPLINLVGNFKPQFINISDRIYHSIIQNLIFNNTFVMLNYDVQSKVTNSYIDASPETKFYDFLLARKLYDPNFGQSEQLFLNNASSIFSKFLGSGPNIFFRSNSNHISTPWVNYAVLKTLLDLESNNITLQLYPQLDLGTTKFPSNSISTSSSVVISSSTSTFSLGSFGFVVLMCTFIFIILGSRRKKLK